MSVDSPTIEQESVFRQGFALVVCVQAYQQLPHLPQDLHKNVEAIKVMLTAPQACAYPPAQVKTLANEEATFANIETELHWLTETTQEEDTVLLYFCGYGESAPENDQSLHFLPYDSHVSRGETAVQNQMLTTALQNIPAQNIAIIFDCYSLEGHERNENLNTLQMGTPNNVALLSIVQDANYAKPKAQESFNSTTTALLEGLRGITNNSGENYIQVHAMFNHILQAVPLERRAFSTNDVGHQTTSFPIALAQLNDIPIYPLNHPVPFLARPVFNKLFAGYRQLRLQRVFDRGWSGANVYEISPYKEGSDSPDLNTVIKFGPKEQIVEEWQAYNRWIKDKVPNATKIVDQPVYDPLNDWGALRYPLVGEGVFSSHSLGELFNELSVEQLAKNIPDWVCPSLERLWGDYRTGFDYTMRQGFAFWLPKNLDQECVLLKQRVQHYLPNIQVNAQHATFVDGIQLANPLYDLEALLDEPLTVNISPIHGDLNLENILLIRNHTDLNMQLIDFARARRDFVLHDLLCLETGVLLNILPTLTMSVPDPLHCLLQLLYKLHLSLVEDQTDIVVDAIIEKPFRFLEAFRQKTRPYLRGYYNWSNYYKGLIVYLLGAIGFRSLAVAEGERPLPREFAYWGAAIVKQLESDASLFAPLFKKDEPPSAPPTLEQKSATSFVEPDDVNKTANIIAFRNVLVDHFSKQDLRDLCDELFVDPENIPDGTLKTQAMQIVKYFKRRVQLDQLYNAAKEMRPGAHWQSLFD